MNSMVASVRPKASVIVAPSPFLSLDDWVISRLLRRSILLGMAMSTWGGVGSFSFGKYALGASPGRTGEPCRYPHHTT